MVSNQMLRLGIFLALTASALSMDQMTYALQEKWVEILNNTKQRWGSNQRRILTAEEGSLVKVFCLDFRMPTNPNDPCLFSQVYLDDGVEKRKVCGSQKDFQYIGQSSKMTVEYQITGAEGTLECVAKAVHPPKNVETIEVSLGGGVKRVSFPEENQRGLDQDRAWRFVSTTDHRVSLQCDIGMSWRFSNGICGRDILTISSGGASKQFCGYEKVVEMSKGLEITIRVETFPGTNGHITCVAQAITGHDPNEHNNVPFPEEDSSEFGVVPGHQGTTCPCGMANKDAGRIINGTEAHEGKFPFMVSLRKLDGTHFCGASILTSRHILTAAHCVSDRWAKNVPVPEEWVPTVGVHRRREDAAHGETQRLKVEQVFVPDNWFADKGSLEADIAILVLSSAIKYSKWVSPVCLSPVELPITNKYIKAMGWGRAEDTYFPDKLRETYVQVLDMALCNNNPKETCFKTGPSSSCHGDSGGPYVYLDPETNRFTQVALVSYGFGSCTGSFFIGTNVTYWYPWIQNIVKHSANNHGLCIRRE